MRKKKTPEELAAEAEQEDLDDFTSRLTKNAFCYHSFHKHLHFQVVLNFELNSVFL
jgi:hypothetical protein